MKSTLQAVASVLSDSTVKAVLAGRSFRIAAPEHLICMKLHALKFGRESRMDRDVADILHMMKQCGWTPDADAFSDACSQYGTPDLRDLIRRRWTS